MGGREILEDRREMRKVKEGLSVFLSAVVTVLLLPCILSFFLTGEEVCALRESIGVEEALPALLQRQLSGEEEKEMIKAQAVILRSNYLWRQQEGEAFSELLEEGLKEGEKGEQRVARTIKEAVRETENQVLTLDGEVKYAPYHQASGGQTRSGVQAMEDEAFSYLTAVDSSWDKEGGEYTSSIWVPISQLPRELEVEKRDESGYVLTLLADGRPISGEQFRVEMGLPSSCFSMEEQGESMRFYCKGRGHGLGLSQYGAAYLAESGKNYEEILAYYFPELRMSDYGG